MDSVIITANQRKLLEMVSDGFSYKEIALATGKSYSTVRGTLSYIREKLGAKNTVNAVKIVMMENLNDHRVS